MSNPDNYPKFGGAFLLLVALLYFSTYQSPAKEKTYMEFVNDYMTKN